LHNIVAGFTNHLPESRRKIYLQKYADITGEGNGSTKIFLNFKNVSTNYDLEIFYIFVEDSLCN
jgi:hypothetical protein